MKEKNAKLYIDIYPDAEEKAKKLINFFENYSKTSLYPIYIINKPLDEKEKKYPFDENAFLILIPNKKISLINLKEKESEEFEDYVYEIEEFISTAIRYYGFKDLIGSFRKWKDKIMTTQKLNDIEDFNKFLEEMELGDSKEKNLSKILISFLTGSINDIKRIKSLAPENIVEKIKQKIILLDGEQTRFIYKEPNDKVIKIQGLSGTGKTELLLHKLRRIYTSHDEVKILFTCHNRVLSKELKKRVYDFFNQMKVSKQIDPEHLIIVHGWGEKFDKFSGAYRYITDFYNITFHNFSSFKDFDRTCQEAIKEIEKLKEEQKENFRYAFDYSLIDESQDFPDSFFKLIETVTKKKVYIAGDIFQDIFQKEDIKKIAEAHFVLSRCYRTSPITLMFAHALGLALFEEKPLNWLEREEWEVYGYSYTKEKDYVLLKREPIVRFDEFDESLEKDSIEIIETDDAIRKTVDIINRLKDKFSIDKEDVGIIFLDEEQYIYDYTYILEKELFEHFKWMSNIGYQTKIRTKERVYISNRNNVKGLEFPFVICITKNIKRNYRYRNTLYSMLTRSFIKSFLIVESSSVDSEIYKGLDFLKSNGYLKIKEPKNKEEIKRQILKYKQEKIKSYQEFLEEILNELSIEKKFWRRLINAAKDIFGTEEWDKEKLKNYFKDNAKYLEKYNEGQR